MIHGKLEPSTSLKTITNRRSFADQVIERTTNCEGSLWSGLLLRHPTRVEPPRQKLFIQTFSFFHWLQMSKLDSEKNLVVVVVWFELMNSFNQDSVRDHRREDQNRLHVYLHYQKSFSTASSHLSKMNEKCEAVKSSRLRNAKSTVKILTNFMDKRHSLSLDLQRKITAK